MGNLWQLIHTGRQQCISHPFHSFLFPPVMVSAVPEIFALPQNSNYQEDNCYNNCHPKVTNMPLQFIFGHIGIILTSYWTRMILRTNAALRHSRIRWASKKFLNYGNFSEDILVLTFLLVEQVHSYLFGILLYYLKIIWQVIFCWLQFLWWIAIVQLSRIILNFFDFSSY